MKVRRIPFSPDEWLAGTAELSPYDRGVYITICALIYSRGERIEAEVLARHLGVHGNAINASLARLAAARKITRNGYEITQKRCEIELENARKSSGNAPENGQKTVGNGLEIEGQSNAINGATKSPRARVEDISSSSFPIEEEKKVVGVRSPRRGARLQQDVELSPEWAEAAKTARTRAGLPELNLDTEFEKFRNHWLAKPGQNAMKLDWRRTWVNWALTATPPRQPAPNGNGRYGYDLPIQHDYPTEPPPPVSEMWKDD